MISTLIERLEKAPGQDRQIDADLHRLSLGVGRKAPLYWSETPSYTSSTDACLSLVDRLLPINSLRMSVDPSGNGADVTWWPDGLTSGTRVQGDGIASTLPVAICLALLRALKHREQGNG